MDLTCLGHASWLIEAAGLRLLCDPLIELDHYAGMFEVSPRRRLRAEALRPDFVLVSHRHPDHFDVPSLARLARLDPETVVVTPDALVASSARQLGFSTVHEVPAGQLIELDGVRLVTTESAAEEEWGVMIACDDAVIWNQIDTVFRGPGHLRRVKEGALEALGTARIDLALIQWQPLLEIAAQLGQALAFPLDGYARILSQLPVVDARAIVPASSGSVHAAAWGWLNHVVFPVDEARFRRDAARVCPGARVFSDRLGARYRVRGETVEVDEGGGEELIEELAGGPTVGYRPFEVPALVDPNLAQLGGEALERARLEVLSWIEGPLVEALVAAYPDFGVDGALRFVVELVFPDTRELRTLIIEGAGGRVEAGADPGWDAYLILAGTSTWEVIGGRRNWGQLLLSGTLRGVTRAYSIIEGRARAANLSPTFVYYALSYDEAVRRSTEWELECALRGATNEGRP